KSTRARARKFPSGRVLQASVGGGSETLAATPQTGDTRMNELHPAHQTVLPILNEAAALTSRWTGSRANAPQTARDLLAVWAHLLRFPDSVGDNPSAQRLAQLVQGERTMIVQQLLNLSPPTQWLSAAQELESSWDSAGGAAALE